MTRSIERRLINGVWTTVDVDETGGGGDLPPATPDGDVLTVVEGSWQAAEPTGGQVPFVSDDPPASPTDGMLWWDPDDDTPASGGSQPVFVQKTLDSSDVLALFSAGAEIVASPGAGKAIVPISFSITYLPGGTPYTDHGGGIVLVTTSTGVQSWDNGKSGNGFWNTSDPAVYAPGFVSLLDSDPTNIEDQPLMLVEDTADPTGGDGSLVVAVVYYVLDLT